MKKKMEYIFIIILFNLLFNVHEITSSFTLNLNNLKIQKLVKLLQLKNDVKDLKMM